MLPGVLYRIALMIPTMLIVTVLVFCMTFLLPGDPALSIAGEGATVQQVEDVREQLGLDKPVLEQFASWFGGFVRGDLGTSMFSTRSVSSEILLRVPATLSLAAMALLVAVLISMPSGIWAALHRGRLGDRVATVGSSLGVSIPNFWLGFMLILAFALNLSWFPAGGYEPISEGFVEWLRHLLLPAVTLGAAAAAELTRQLRSSMVGTLEQDFVRTATAKGLSRWDVVGKHALKNAANPYLTMVGTRIASLLGGTIVVESVFNYPGLGSLTVNSVLTRDIPMIQGLTLVAAAAVMVSNLVVDLLYRYFDPRVRAG